MILIDTTPLVALVDSRDAKHAVAVAHLRTLGREEFVVCDAVLTEACFHLPHTAQRQRLRFLVRELGVRALAVDDDGEVWSAVFDWLLKYADHEPDWTDACLAVFSGRDRALKVWTYDQEFRTHWRRPNGTAIPLAVRLT